MAISADRFFAGFLSASPHWRSLRQIVLVFAVPLAVVVFLVFQETLGNYVTSQDPVQVFGAIAIFFTGIVFGAFCAVVLGCAFWLHNREQGFASAIQDLRGICDSLNAHSLKFMTNKDMGELEGECEADEIWICSPDLHRDVLRNAKGRTYEGNPFAIKNLCGENASGKQVVYRYFMSKHRASEVERFGNIYREYLQSGRVFQYVLSDEEWHRMPLTDVDLIVFWRSPQNGSDAPPEAYHELTVNRDLWLKVPEETASDWLRRMKTVKDAH